MSAHFGRFVAYYRVSTDKQGESGFGLDAQRQAVMNYLNGGPWRVRGGHCACRSRPRYAPRPVFRRHWRPAGASIAKLDRLSRNLAFIATLMDSGAEFVATDNPHANKLTIHILAAVAEHEREAIRSAPKPP